MPRKLKRTSLETFKTLARDGGNTDGTLVPKGFACEVKAPDGDLAGERRLQFTISTGSVDRELDTIDPGGVVNLKKFVKEGVVLWAHASHLPPVAKPLKVWQEGDAIKAIAEFMPPDMDHPLGRGFGATVHRYFTEGFMKSVSIGFVPREWEWSSDREGGIDFKRWELLEFSAVPVPANREAVVDLASKGFDMLPALGWVAENSSDLILPRSIVDDVVASVIDSKSQSSSAPGQRELVFDAKSPISYNQAHPDGTPVAPRDQEWDGPTQVVEADIDDLKVMSAWRTEDAESKADYKLPHHMAAGEHAVVWSGVTAAMGALLGARGGVDIPDGDRRGVYDHLARHYRDDFEQEPPDFRDDIQDDSKDIKAIPKAGRTLSKKNENDLKAARDLINAVLEQVAGTSADDDEANDDNKAADESATAIADAPSVEPPACKCSACGGNADSSLPDKPADKQPVAPVESDFDPNEFKNAFSELAREIIDKKWKRLTGEL